jgi:hypothetical protein
MLVYGDASRRVHLSQVLTRLRARMQQAEALPGGIVRHALLAALLIEAGELAQGVLDAAFLDTGRDELHAPGATCLRLPLGMARALWTSYTSGFERTSPLPWAALEDLVCQGLPEELTLKVPEGYAYYALYPEAYLEAASRLRLPRPPKVIGIRSIGTSLACAVAAATGAREAPLTVRPAGHPFQRTLSLGPRLERELLRDTEGVDFALVDEGPGLSGSSLGAVADFLEDRGIPSGRLHFFPSHPGELGPSASERHRRRWAGARRHTVDFDALFVHPPGAPSPLVAWVEDLTGPALAPLEDVGGGAWRNKLFHDERDWPAVNVQQERRKYVLHAERGTFLLKFAGLGAHGERRLERARQLAEAGWCPPVEGLRHGFLVQRWMSGARPLSQARPVPRAELVERVSTYLGFRARHFAVAGGACGALPGRLLEMARHNTAQSLGHAWAARLDRWGARLAWLTEQRQPVETDNKLHAWEWLVPPEGGLLKADALDHHEAHDLIGCQDIAWDVAGATVELALTSQEQAVLVQRVTQAGGRRVDPELLAFYLPCYLAFQLGACTLAATVLATPLPAEATRLRGAAERYAARLGHYLA